MRSSLVWSVKPMNDNKILEKRTVLLELIISKVFSGRYFVNYKHFGVLS